MRRPNSPTIDLLILFGVVYLFQQLGGVFGLGTAWFALAAPVARPWTLVTNVYAHASLGHLLANAIALGIVGIALEQFTTRARFHGFVLVTGVLAALTQLLVGILLATPVAVLGASGAILALYGYVLAGNPIAGGLLGLVELSRRAKVVLIVGIALVMTIVTAGPGVALVAHFTGFCLGLVAGRLRVLRVR
ncbi:rhomboid family intramembrane serine protease [Haloplanus natans]|uniref:rhomboid family intramembrane serine protease n=1 Tax=Haloplanus natans TaxID=376171 RepID=UPI0006780497|nr:rhomboid family intramembrane serine protease [Haloplanus natans]